MKRRKREEYFCGGGSGELGHGGSREVSRFLVWMRTNHGGISGSRYGVERSRCECGGIEMRDHILLYCKLYDGVGRRCGRVGGVVFCFTKGGLR